MPPTFDRPESLAPFLPPRRRARRILVPVACLSLAGCLSASVIRAQDGTTAPTPLFRTAGASVGKPLVPNSAEALRPRLAGVTPQGRVTPLARESFSTLAPVAAGQHVLLPLADAEDVEAVVNLVRDDADGTRRVSGTLFEAAPGTFNINVRGAEVTGFIVRHGQGVAFQVEAAPGGGLHLREVPLNEVVCEGIPRKPTDAPTALPDAADAPQEAVPLLSSRPWAVAQLYLDFDGETVTDPAWNGGQTINAASYNLSAATISAIFDRVKEDYWPFDINVTTDVAQYNAAAPGRRMRCIITPTDTAAPGSGGVAYLNSFARGVNSPFSTTIPCWVFNSDVVGISEAISHELGHTFGLHHDGREVPGTGHEEYFLGQGSGATGWCPIMGAGYYKNVVQWSKGEYQYANNQEDDVAIISNSANGFGYVYTIGEPGNTRATAAALTLSGAGSINQGGLIINAADADFYAFTTGGGAVTINANSASASPDLDVALELQNAVGTAVLTSNPPSALSAGLSASLAPGTYYLKVSGSGAADPFTTGYSTYGSVGSYVLTGTVPPVTGGIGVKNDFNGDGRPDLIWENDATGGLVAWFMNGNTLVSQSVVGQVDPAWKIRGTGDFNGDGKPDVVWENDATGALIVWLMNGLTLTSQATFSPYPQVDPSWKIMAVADFNGDGKPDLVWENEKTGSLVVWYLNGTTLLSQTTFSPYPAVDPSWKIMGAGDFNGDGKPDLVWENQVNGSLVVWMLNNNVLLFQTTFGPYPQVDPSWKVRSVADFNGDGKPDLVWENDTSGSLVLWYLNGVNLTSQTPLGPIGQVDPTWKIRSR